MSITIVALIFYTLSPDYDDTNHCVGWISRSFKGRVQILGSCLLGAAVTGLGYSIEFNVGYFPPPPGKFHPNLYIYTGE